MSQTLGWRSQVSKTPARTVTELDRGRRARTPSRSGWSGCSARSGCSAGSGRCPWSAWYGWSTWFGWSAWLGRSASLALLLSPLAVGCASITLAPPGSSDDDWSADETSADDRAEAAAADAEAGAAPASLDLDKPPEGLAGLHRLLFSDPFTDAPLDVVGLPGEYEPVDRVLLGWHGGNWDYVDFFASVLREVLADTRALIAVESEVDQVMLLESLADEGVDVARVDFVIEELDSMWIRDYGPLFVRTVSGGYRVIDLPYHPDRGRDDSYPSRFAGRERLPVSRPALEMEGGHLQADGVGRCIVTDDVMTLNEGFLYQESDVRRLLRDFFGCRQVSIVPALFGEETGHVDVFAYVTGPGRVLVGRYERRQDGINARRLDRAARLLREQGWEVNRIPMPSNSRRTVFRTHTNVIVTDRTVLVPVFRRDRRYERLALQTFASAFPDRRVVPIVADDVIDLAGAVHCTVVTVPATRRPPTAPVRARARAGPARPAALAPRRRVPA